MSKRSGGVVGDRWLGRVIGLTLAADPALMVVAGKILPGFLSPGPSESGVDQDYFQIVIEPP
jgi:hypothetical protein